MKLVALAAVLVVVAAACGSGAAAPTPTPIRTASPLTRPATPTPLCPAAPSQPSTKATITLEKGGAIVIQLKPDKAPKTVSNFRKLASERFYDGKRTSSSRAETRRGMAPVAARSALS